MKRVFVPFLGILMMLSIAISPVWGVELERPVDFWVPGDYESIQDAINNAPANSVIGLSRDLETTAMTINFNRPMVIRGQGTGGVTTVRLANDVGTYDYVFEITVDHCGLQDLIIEEIHWATEAGIRVEGDFCAINEVEMHGFDERGIWAVGASDLEISYCTLDLSGPIADAIILSTCPNAHIEGNTITSQLGTGIDVSYSDDVVIELNSISDCLEEDGIYAYYSHRITVRDNDVYTSMGGLTLSWCLDGNVYDNTFDLNSDHGVSLWNGASDNEIRNNIITNTYGSMGETEWGDGISIDDSTQICEGNVIKRNQIEGNYRGVYAHKPEVNYIYLNNIVNNDDYASGYLNQYSSQTALLYTYGGVQYTGFLGNYWSEYTGVDVAPMNGIGDTPFEDTSHNVWDENPLIATETHYIELGEAPTTEEFVLYLTTGWNLVSLPVMPDLNAPGDIFGTLAYYLVYTWSGTEYIIPGTMEEGVGYWVLVLVDDSVTVTGAPVTTVHRALPSGWSLIGGTNQVTPTAGTGPFTVYTYNGAGYDVATEYQPGEGYWGLMLAAGDFDTPLV